jgi:UDP-N-acetyl-D-glucosamine dehydrogenase
VSPALDTIRLLQEKGAEVCYHDPYVPEMRPSDISITAVELKEETVGQIDWVVITTDHRIIDWGKVRCFAKTWVDTRMTMKKSSYIMRKYHLS